MFEINPKKELTAKQAVLEKLSLVPTKTALLEFIRWLDLTAREEIMGGDLNPLTPLLLAQVIIVLGNELDKIKKVSPQLLATVNAAKNYIQDPNDATHLTYFEAATASYPFGPGEGCYQVEELGYSNCEWGSGCPSGAGTLYQISLQLGEEMTVKLIKDSLSQWFQGN